MSRQNTKASIYRVEVEHQLQGCSFRDHLPVYLVVGPGNCAEGPTYEHESDAQIACDVLNAAVDAETKPESEAQR